MSAYRHTDDEWRALNDRVTDLEILLVKVANNLSQTGELSEWTKFDIFKLQERNWAKPSQPAVV